jgi:hypothetical protein
MMTEAGADTARAGTGVGLLVAGEWLNLVLSGRHGRGAAGWIQAQELAQVEDQGGEV